MILKLASDFMCSISVEFQLSNYTPCPKISDTPCFKHT